MIDLFQMPYLFIRKMHCCFGFSLSQSLQWQGSHGKTIWGGISSPPKRLSSSSVPFAVAIFVLDVHLFPEFRRKYGILFVCYI